MGNDELLRDPASWPRFRPGDDLCGHAATRSSSATAGGRYCDVAGELGLGEPGVSRGIAMADVDGDGRLDFAVANQWAPSSFYRNDGADAAARSSACTCGCRLPAGGADADRAGPSRRRRAPAGPPSAPRAR